MSYYISYPNRTVCAILDEMREAHKTHNYSYLPGLIEELQTLGNRMEAALSDKHDLRRLSEERHKMKKEYRELREKVKKLREIAGEKEKDDE